MSFRNTPRNRRSVQEKQFISADTGQSYQNKYQSGQSYQNKYQSQQQVQQQFQTPPQQYPQQQRNQQNLNNSTIKPDQNVSDEVEPEPEEELPDAANPFKENDDELDESGLVDENGKLKFKKIFTTTKKASVRTKEQRIRQNRRLRKTIVPKNALMALNELKGVSIGDFIINNNPSGGFIASVTINGNEYEGRGPSKNAAKNNACEKAMPDYILAKMRERPRKLLLNGSNNGNSGGESMETNEVGGGAAALDETEDVPMVNLASFAIYKLFLEWENEGYIIPEMHPAAAGNVSDNQSTTGGGGPVKEPKKPVVRNDLPQNWEAMHPATLLCVMRQGVTYVDKGSTGEPPNSVVYTLGINVDGEDFEGCGRSKKIARRNVAAVACNTLFNTNFDMEAAQVQA